MEFREEMRALVQTPEKNWEEYNKKMQKKGEENAGLNYIDIKNIITEKVKRGEFEIAGDNYIISFDYDSPFINEFVEIKFIHDEESKDNGLQCKILNAVSFEAYNNELKRLAKIDGIELTLAYRYKEDNSEGIYFDIPGNYEWLKSKNALQFIQYGHCVIRCSFVF